MVIYLEGLDCANCAEKIRAGSEKLDGVERAEMNFISKKMTIKLIDDKTDKRAIFKKIKSIVKSLEPDVVVSLLEGNTKVKNESDEKGDKILLIAKFAVSAVLFILGLIFEGSTQELWFFIAAYFIIGYDVIRKAGYNIIKGRPFDECLLMTIASLGAFLIKGYHEAVAVMFLYQLGEAFQDYAVERSRKSITSLLDIRPDYANVKRGDEIKKVSPNTIEIGETIIIKAGERIPLDAIIISGETTLDTSALTGESVPRKAVKGDTILSGCVNLSGYIEAEVNKEYGESTVSKILDLVENSAAKKAKTENFITRFARIYTPIVVIAAFLLVLIPSLINIPNFIAAADSKYIIDWYFNQDGWLYRALQFLVVSCPCALVISVPLSFFGGIGGASKKGVLVKGGNSLEMLADCTTMVFDKTGTLTNGTFTVTEVYTNTTAHTQNDLLKIAAYAEKNSNHPVAVSIIEYYKSQNGEAIPKNISYTEMAGMGVKASTDSGDIIYAGNINLMNEAGIKFNEPLNADGTIVYIAVNSEYLGYIRISDTIKADTKNAVGMLKKRGIKTIMLTGDRKKSAEETAAAIGIDEYKSELLPNDKVSALEQIMSANDSGRTVFVGDGINDAPVLMRADVGIAMGALGSDAAIDAADIVLMTDEPSRIDDAIRISKKTRAIVKQNIVFSIGVKLVVLVFAMLGMTTMWAAVFADVGVSLIAVMNALRARKV